MQATVAKYPTLEASDAVDVPGFTDIKWPLCPSTWAVQYSDDPLSILCLTRVSPKLRKKRSDVPETGPVAEGDPYVAVSAPVSAALFTELLNMATPSPLGKNTETVHDPALRRSHEIKIRDGGEAPYLYVPDRRPVDDLVSKALVNMGFGGSFRVEPHKAVLYEKGDFFVEHVDSNHGHANLVATATLEMALDETPFHNCLEITEDGRVWKPAFDKAARLALCVMGRGVKHRVQPAEARRLVVTFDILRDARHGSIDLAPSDSARAAVSRCVMSGLTELRAAGVKKFAVLCSYAYDGVKEKSEGLDSVIENVLKEAGAHPEDLQLALEDNSRFIHGDVYSERTGHYGTFSTLMVEGTGSDQEDDEEVDTDSETGEAEKKDRDTNKKEKEEDSNGGDKEAEKEKDNGVGAEKEKTNNGKREAEKPHGEDKEGVAPASPETELNEGQAGPAAKRPRGAFAWTPSLQDKPHPIYTSRVCLGDVCLVRLPCSRPWQTVTPHGEVYLGNEGFTGGSAFQMYRAIQGTLS